MATRNYPESWGADETGLWENVSFQKYDDFGDYLADDRHAQVLFEAGWMNDDIDQGTRTAVRDAFMDYCIEEGYFEDPEDFDWESWREYMGYERA